MPNGKMHGGLGMLTGGCASASLALADGGNPLLEGAGGVAGGLLGGKLPDLLEPALNPRHRNHCHSWAAGAVDLTAASTWVRARQAQWRERAERHGEAARGAQDLLSWFLHWLAYIGLHLASGFVIGAAAGYLSHLVADATTSAGLPVA